MPLTLVDTIDFEAGNLSEVASSSGTGIVIAGAAHDGSYGAQLDSLGAGDSEHITTNTHAYSAGELCGGWFRFQTVSPAARFAFMYPRDGGDPPLDLGIATDGKLSLLNDVAGGEIKSAAALLAATWYFIEIYWTRAGVVKVRVNGTEVISTTGYDTAVASPGSIDYEFACWDQPSAGPYVQLDTIEIYNGAADTDVLYDAPAAEEPASLIIAAQDAYYASMMR